jgi:hypothetical protein
MGVNMNTNTLKKVIREKYAWPGGYEMYGITSCGDLLCCDCMRKEYRQVAWSMHNNVSDDWKIVGITNDSTFEGDEYCGHCNKQVGN